MYNPDMFPPPEGGGGGRGHDPVPWWAGVGVALASLVLLWIAAPLGLHINFVAWVAGTVVIAVIVGSVVRQARIDKGRQ